MFTRTSLLQRGREFVCFETSIAIQIKLVMEYTP